MLDILTPTDDALRPMKWQQGNIAMSSTHFYMIFNDKKLGITVNFTNRLTNKKSSRDGFESVEAAQEWVKTNHYDVKQKSNQNIFTDTGLNIGQRWTNKFNRYMIAEIVDTEQASVSLMTYYENDEPSGTVIKNDLGEIKDLLSLDYYLMLDGESVTDCLHRNMGALCD